MDSSFLGKVSGAIVRSLIGLLVAALPCSAAPVPWTQLPEPVRAEAQHFVNGNPTAETRSEKGQTIYHFSGKKNGKHNEVDLASDGKFLFLEQQLGLGGCPKPVQNVFRNYAAGGKVEQVTRIAQPEEQTWEAEISKNDKSTFVEVDKTGKVLSEETETDLAQAPAAVQATIKRELYNAQITFLGKVVQPGEVSIHVEANGNNKDFEFYVANDGDLLRRELTITEVPGAVQKTILAKMGKAPDVTIIKDCESSDCQYTVDFTEGSKDRSLVVGMDGSVISESEVVPLNQTPEAVQKLIKDETAGATVGTITKTQETGLLYYEVEVTRDGNDESFEATPDGKILD